MTNDFIIKNTVLEKYTGSASHVIIPEGITAIGNKAFYKCENLISVTIPESVTNIMSHAFCFCFSLESVHIGNSIRRISSDAFWGTPWLKDRFQKSPLVTVNHILIEGIHCQDTVSVPDDVLIIGESAFGGNKNITSVTMGNNITAIQAYAFFSCENLHSVVLSDNLKIIESDAFANCKNLNFIRIRNILLKKEMIDRCRNYRHITLEDFFMMIISGHFDDYYVQNSSALKDIIWEIFALCPDDEKTLLYIENHLEEMLCDLIHAGHENIIQKVLDSGRFITRETIDFCIQTAIASQNHTVQLLLTDYKYQHFNFCNPADKLKL